VREIGAEGIVPKRDRSHYRGGQSWIWLKTGSSDRHVPPHQIEGRRVPRNATANCGERERCRATDETGPPYCLTGGCYRNLLCRRRSGSSPKVHRGDPRIAQRRRESGGAMRGE
jgi:hypothetical protein